jgi:hypothetical protein
MTKPTFDDKFQEIRRDLRSVMERLNRDGEEDLALCAQQALMSVSTLHRRLGGIGELDWDWNPASDDPADPRGAR